MRYQTAIFDMDGTILETLEDMCASVNVTMDHVGYPRRTMDEVRRFVGNGAAKLIERCMPAGAEDPRYPAALEFYRAYYDAHAQIKTGPYPGIPELLNKLSREGVRLAVVSNKPDEAVRALTERYFPGVFPVAIGNRDGWATKPAPDSVYEAMRLLGARRESTVYVGDSDVDVDTARNAGLDSVIVTWGFRDEDFLRAHGAQHLAHNADELYEML
mgnify:FL=1